MGGGRHRRQNPRGSSTGKKLRGDIVAEIMIRNNVSYYYHVDILGSIRVLTDASENTVATYQYDAFGIILQETGVVKNPYRFTGREWDFESGLYYYRARYYNSVTGRFVQKDPAGMIDGVNIYLYVHENPVNGKDPSGKWEIWDLNWGCLWDARTAHDKAHRLMPEKKYQNGILYSDKYQHGYVGCYLRQHGCSRADTKKLAEYWEERNEEGGYQGSEYSIADIAATMTGWDFGYLGAKRVKKCFLWHCWHEWKPASCASVCGTLYWFWVYYGSIE